MTQTTTELALEVLDAISHRDLQRAIGLADPEVEWHSFFADLGAGGTYRGHDGTRSYMADLEEAWEIVRPDIDETLAVGDVAVLVGRLHYKGRGSGVETETPAGWTLRFREGKLLSFRAFRDPESAIAAIGERP